MQTEYGHRLITVLLAFMFVTVFIVKNRGSRFQETGAAVFYPADQTTLVSAVNGDLLHPGIYPLLRETRVSELIDAAGPKRNISAFSGDSQGNSAVEPGCLYNVSIDRSGNALLSKSPIPTPQKMLLGVPLDINSMNREDLEVIPGVGHSTSAKIIEYRERNGGSMKVSDLRMIEGIGEEKYSRIAEFFNPGKTAKHDGEKRK